MTIDEVGESVITICDNYADFTFERACIVPHVTSQSFQRSYHQFRLRKARDILEWHYGDNYEDSLLNPNSGMIGGNINDEEFQGTINFQIPNLFDDYWNTEGP